jgi:hypothetical protein
MKTLIFATLLAMLAGCSSMGTSGSSMGSSSGSGAQNDYSQQDDVFQSYVN